MSNNASLVALQDMNSFITTNDLLEIVFIIIICLLAVALFNKLHEKFNNYLAKTWNDMKKVNKINKEIAKKNKR